MTVKYQMPIHLRNITGCFIADVAFQHCLETWRTLLWPILQLQYFIKSQDILGRHLSLSIGTLEIYLVIGSPVNVWPTAGAIRSLGTCQTTGLVFSYSLDQQTSNYYCQSDTIQVEAIHWGLHQLIEIWVVALISTERL